MKISDLFPPEGKNLKAAKQIRMKRKDLAKKGNPGETEDPNGWQAGPHQGSFDRMRMTR